MPKILVSALEESANVHLEKILKYNKNHELEIIGLFDERLGNPLVSSKEFNVMGIFAIFPKIFIAKKTLNKLVELAKDVSKVLLIDSPAFNLPLAKALKIKYPSIKIYYYILPKVWAWKSSRIKFVDKYIDYQISIFPFEKQYFKNSIYFGNPSVEDIPVTFNQLGDEVAFLAGSRKSEIKFHMPIFRELAKFIPNKKLLLIPKNLINNLEIYGDISQFEIRTSGIIETMKESRFAFVCSGTATLETALTGVPFLLLYKTNKLEFLIAKKFVKIERVGLANIIFRKYGLNIDFHKEFLQEFKIEDLLNELESSSQEKFYQNSQLLRKILEDEQPSQRLFNVFLQ